MRPKFGISFEDAKRVAERHAKRIAERTAERALSVVAQESLPRRVASISISISKKRTEEENSIEEFLRSAAP